MVQGESSRKSTTLNNKRKSYRPKQPRQHHINVGISTNVDNAKNNPLNKQITTTINNNIEQIMMSRLIHSGGTLRLMKGPSRDDVKEYIRSGISLSSKHYKDLIQTNNAQKRRIEKNNLMHNMTQQQKSTYNTEQRKRKYNDMSDTQKTVFDAVDALEAEIKANVHSDSELDSDHELDEYLKQNIVHSDSDSEHSDTETQSKKRVLRSGLDLLQDKLNHTTK